MEAGDAEGGSGMSPMHGPLMRRGSVSYAHRSPTAAREPEDAAPDLSHEASSESLRQSYAELQSALQSATGRKRRVSVMAVSPEYTVPVGPFGPGGGRAPERRASIRAVPPANGSPVLGHQVPNTVHPPLREAAGPPPPIPLPRKAHDLEARLDRAERRCAELEHRLAAAEHASTHRTRHAPHEASPADDSRTDGSSTASPTSSFRPRVPADELSLLPEASPSVEDEPLGDDRSESSGGADAAYNGKDALLRRLRNALAEEKQANHSLQTRFAALVATTHESLVGIREELFEKESEAELLHSAVQRLTDERNQLLKRLGCIKRSETRPAASLDPNVPLVMQRLPFRTPPKHLSPSHGRRSSLAASPPSPCHSAIDTSMHLHPDVSSSNQNLISGKHRTVYRSTGIHLPPDFSIFVD
ncbi:hypothetical protein DIPPA_14734 [Diplonema papillatum]|nr:hypothetical protein DIPPA_14734 [Diplonema papillatum]